MLTCARCTVIYNTFGVIVRRYVHIANYARDRCNRRACIPTVSRYVYTCSLQIHFMKFHFMVSCRSRGLRFGAKNWSNRCDAPAFTPLPSEAQVVRTLSRQIILRNLLFTLFLPLYSRVYLLYSYIRYILYSNFIYDYPYVHKISKVSPIYIYNHFLRWFKIDTKIRQVYCKISVVQR